MSPTLLLPVRDPPPAAALPTAAKEKIGSWQRPSRRCRSCADISPSSSWPDARAETNERPRLSRKKASRTRQGLHPVTSHAGCYPSLAAALPAAAKERICSGSVSRRCLLAHHPARLDKPSEEGSKERVTSPAHHHLLQPCCISGPRGFDPEVDADVQAGEHPTTALDAKEEDQGKSGRWLFLEAFPVALPMATIFAMASSQESTGSRLMARPAALLLLLAALAAPAQARSAPENRAGEKSAQNAELFLSPTPQLLELQREKATARWYDASGDSFT
jgi:hypothetical protein